MRLLQRKYMVQAKKMIPWYWGRAWSEDYEYVIVCYPIPLNIVVGLLRKLYHKMRYVHLISRWDARVLDAAARAEAKGRDVGYSTGYKNGRRDEATAREDEVRKQRLALEAALRLVDNAKMTIEKLEKRKKPTNK